MRLVLLQSISSAKGWHYDKGDELDSSTMPDGESPDAWINSGIAKPARSGDGGGRERATKGGAESAVAERDRTSASDAA